MNKELIKALALTAVGVVIGLIVYDFLLKPMISSNFEQDNYDIDSNGNVMKAA